ncbi:hypothetical protein OG21DRAFT_1603119 [Imleria badia]|nr:hypothetical protein OG21DRAFT_1603119 [Imleria badia]
MKKEKKHPPAVSWDPVRKPVGKRISVHLRRPTSAKHDEAAGESDIPSEVEEREQGKNACKGIQAFEQRDLVALAFASDNLNVVQVRESGSSGGRCTCGEKGPTGSESRQSRAELDDE